MPLIDLHQSPISMKSESFCYQPWQSGLNFTTYCCWGWVDGKLKQTILCTIIFVPGALCCFHSSLTTNKSLSIQRIWQGTSTYGSTKLLSTEVMMTYGWRMWLSPGTLCNPLCGGADRWQQESATDFTQCYQSEEQSFLQVKIPFTTVQLAG